MSESIYHYTTSAKAQAILNEGWLKVSKWEKENGIKPPALWLSTDPVWEHTATKMAGSPAGIRRLTFDEQHKLAGCVRFALPFDVVKERHSVCSWAAYKHKSNTKPEVYDSMERMGVAIGADPKAWFAVFDDVPVSLVTDVAVWNGQEWVSLDKPWISYPIGDKK